jgi:hypothetical protein
MTMMKMKKIATRMREAYLQIKRKKIINRNTIVKTRTKQITMMTMRTRQMTMEMIGDEGFPFS